MTTKFTLNDLFLYHYNELSVSDRIAMESLIASDEVFRAESHKIKQMKATLNSEKLSPSQSSINFILDYDKKSSNELAY
ncbi:MAG: hypothetical protein ACPGVH_03540 [Chitinophagales bacterium]